MSLVMLNGSTAYLSLPEGYLVLGIQVLTILIESALIGGYWYWKRGKLRALHLGLLVAAANLLTAAIGVGIGMAVKDDFFEGRYYWGSDGALETVVPIGLALFAVVGFFMIVLVMGKSKSEEKPSFPNTPLP